MALEPFNRRNETGRRRPGAGPRGRWRLGLAWTPALKEIGRATVNYGKPVVFTEVGVQARANAYRDPWVKNPTAPLDLAEQARLLQRHLSGHSRRGQRSLLVECLPAASGRPSPRWRLHAAREAGGGCHAEMLRGNVLNVLSG